VPAPPVRPSLTTVFGAMSSARYATTLSPTSVQVTVAPEVYPAAEGAGRPARGLAALPDALYALLAHPRPSAGSPGRRAGRSARRTRRSPRPGCRKQVGTAVPD